MNSILVEFDRKVIAARVRRMEHGVDRFGDVGGTDPEFDGEILQPVQQHVGKGHIIVGRTIQCQCM